MRGQERRDREEQGKEGNQTQGSSRPMVSNDANDAVVPDTDAASYRLQDTKYAHWLKDW